MALRKALTKAPRLAALLAVASLSACGTTAEDPLFEVARGLAQGVFDRDEGPAAPSAHPRQVLTRDIINQVAVPLILVESINTGSALTMVRLAVNGTNETWQGEDNATVTLSREGVLRATRGAGPDLASSDIDGTRAILAGGRNGRAERLYVHVEGDLEQRRLGYSCDITRGGREQVNIFGRIHTLTRVTETCSRNPTGETIENRYWVDGAGFAWASEQWAGPELGHFRFERIYR